MSTSRETIDRLIDALEPLPVRAHPMFGEYAVYCDDRVFGFVCDDVLLVKPVDEAIELVAELGIGHPYPGSKPYREVEEHRWADVEWLHELVQTIAATQPRKPAKQKAAKQSPQERKPGDSQQS